MAIERELRYANVNELYLDPMNPRLGRRGMSLDTTQEDLLNTMKDWVLDELALSYLESGAFWTQEALIVVKEQLHDEECLFVVEGNRRLAALKTLQLAEQGRPISAKWAKMLEGTEIPEGLFDEVPYVLADSRDDVQAFLGFRHVTGIKQWGADEKACFIAKLIDEGDMTYQQVARRIGSHIPTVRKHYIAYRLLLQMEDQVEEFEPARAGRRFAVLYMSIEKQGAQQYLHIDFQAEPKDLRQPVPQEHIQNLAHVARWLFGTPTVDSIIRDTRQVEDFGAILENDDAIEYLESEKEPKFNVAFRISGGDEHEIIKYVTEAAHRVELSLTRAHVFKDSVRLRKEVNRLGKDVLQLISIFPDIRKHLLKDDEE